MFKQSMEFFQYNRKTKLTLLVLVMAYVMFLGSAALVLFGATPQIEGELPYMFFTVDHLMTTALWALGIHGTTNAASKLITNGNGQPNGRSTTSEALE